MKIVLIPVDGDDILVVPTYDGFSFAGLVEQGAFDENIPLYIKTAFPFLSDVESKSIKALKLGPQGFFYHRNQKVVGYALLPENEALVKLRSFTKARNGKELWSQTSSEIRPLIQSIIDSDLYESCSSDIDAYALDRISDSGGMTAKQVAEEFGISLNKATSGLFALASKGFVQCWERLGRVFKITELGLEELNQIGWTPINNSSNAEIPLTTTAEKLEICYNFHMKDVTPEVKFEEPKSQASRDFSTLTAGDLRILYNRIKRVNREDMRAQGYATSHSYDKASEKYANIMGISRKEVNVALWQQTTDEAIELLTYISSHPEKTEITQ